MYCKKCGAALPSHGFVCKRCGTLMDEEQIKKQKQFLKDREKEQFEINFLSDQYRNDPTKRDYQKRKENKYLGAILIVLVVVVLVIFAILKVM